MTLSTNYSKIRFIGYAISTFPAHLRDGLGGGTYLGNDDVQIDIAARIAVLKNAVVTAKAQLPANEDTNQVINVFVAPEFFFHGTQGPYLYADENSDPLKQIMEELSCAINAKDFPNWTFVCGTVITAKVANVQRLFESSSVQIRNATVKFLIEQERQATSGMSGIVSNALHNFIAACQADPDVAVRDRALIVSNIPLDVPHLPLNTNNMTTEKYFISGEDFVLYDTSGKKNVVTEQMTAYPHIDLSNGDIKKSAYDPYAIFRQNYGAQNVPSYMDFGVEICLDHDDQRLRINLGDEPFPVVSDAVHVQLIPSCGMAIQAASVVADKNGFVFNCDGQYPLDGTSNQVNAGTIGGVQCVYVNYNPSPTDTYNYHSAHTQLARVKTAAIGNDPNKNSASFQTLSVNDIVCVAVAEPTLPVGTIHDYFAGGVGAVHIYGLEHAYELYPNVIDAEGISSSK